MSSDIRTCWGLLSGNPEALLSTYISVQQYRYLHACLCFCARAKKVCEHDHLWNMSSTVGGCQHHTFSAIVHHVRTKITSTIYEKESIISRFQSSLVSLLGVNELRFHHRYQRHSLFNYSYWACSVRHCSSLRTFTSPPSKLLLGKGSVAPTGNVSHSHISSMTTRCKISPFSPTDTFM